jgi:DNA transformation protein and related proteins
MKNMGPKSTEWLASVGIQTLDDVARLGVVETYKRVKAAYPDKVTPFASIEIVEANGVTLNLLWGLQAALLDLPWKELPLEFKEELRKQVEGL